MKDIMIEMQDNPACYVQRQIAERIGFNIRIQSSKPISKHETLFRLMAIIPHRICLKNGIMYDGQMTIQNVGKMVVIETRKGFVLKQDADLESIDNKILVQIIAFNRLANVQWIEHNNIRYNIEQTTEQASINNNSPKESSK